MAPLTRRIVVFLALTALSSLASLPAQTVLLEPAAPLLPQHFGTWQMTSPGITGTATQEADAAHAAALQEDGLARFAKSSYTRAGGAPIDLQALQFSDATGAAAALTLYRAEHPGLRPTSAKLGSEAAAGDSEVLFRAGNTVVVATGPRIAPAELQPLAFSLPKISGPKGLSPLLPTLLPAAGLEPGSLRYTLGPASYAATGGVLPADILGFGKSAEAATATYTINRAKETLTLLLYPTPEIAGDRGRAIEHWLNGHPAGLGTVKLRREGPLVLMSAGALSAEEAQRLVENIHLRSEVTWEKKMEPEFHAEVGKTYSLLVSIAVLSGILMAAAILLGLFLGGGRAAVRVMRGKSAAVEPEFLGLGLDRGPARALGPGKTPAQG